MTHNRLDLTSDSARMERVGRVLATPVTDPDRNRSSKESEMPAPAENTPFSRDAHLKTSESDRPFAGPIAALKAEIDRALTIGDGHLAELAHELLCNAEWAQRCLETVRRCAR